MGILKNEKVKSVVENLDKPLTFADSWSFLKKGKIRILIIYEDLSYMEYFKKLKSDYVIEIKGKSYLLVPKCLIRGKYNTFSYYYNNPMPISYVYQKSKLGSKSLYDSKTFAKLDEGLKGTLADTYLDAKTLNVAFSSNLINKMYSENKMSTMNWIVILVVVVIIILVFLQLFGVVDLASFLGVNTGK